MNPSDWWLPAERPTGTACTTWQLLSLLRHVVTYTELGIALDEIKPILTDDGMTATANSEDIVERWPTVSERMTDLIARKPWIKPRRTACT